MIYTLPKLRNVSNNLFKLLVKSSLLASISGLALAAEEQGKTHLLTSEQWNIPRQASSVLSMPALQSAMQVYQAKEGSQLLIKYPGGDEGTLWAYELRGWLISLGVGSNHIELIPGSAKTDQLEISIIQPK
jgi:hypothetical protein